MAKDRKKLQHIHSSIPDKQPTAGSLAVAEIAVNNAAEQEFLSIKNTNDKVVRFSSDGQIIEWIERKEVMPYVGYVRGDGGPTATSGDTPASDEKGSYGISNDDLLNNKSELVFKLNQVAADLTTKHDKVNGAKDMYNEEINPTDDYGVNDGAGFFIDMSRYAMRDGNPSFSALTATCQTTLSGNTYIRDGASANTYGTDTGNTLDIKVTNNIVSGVTWDEILSTKTESISGRTTTIGNDGENLHVIGTTTEVHDENVIITNKSNVTENTSGTTTINNTGKTTVNVVHGTEINSCEGISANTDVFIVKQCTEGEGKAQFDFCDGFSVNSDDVKITECTPDGSIVITEKNATVNAENTTINDSGNTVINTTGNSSANTTGNVVVNTTGTTTETKGGNVTENNQSDKTEYTTGGHSLYVTGDTCITSQAKANFYGKVSTNIGLACDNTTKASATTVVGTSTLDMSGTTTTLNANSTTITSCGDVTINTDELKVKQCGNAGSAEFDFCDGFKVKSDDVEITQCGSNGSITITEATVEVNAGNTTINDSGNTTVNTTGNTNVNTTGDTTFITSGSTTIKTEDGTTIQTTAGDTNINTTGNTNVTSTENVCAVADETAAFKGTVKTNIGKDCSDAGQTTTLNINGDTINESGNSITEISSEKTCIHAGTDLNMGGDTNTRIGYNCNGDSGYTNNTYISASNSAFTYSPNIGISGSNIDINGATSIDISGDTITETSAGKTCIHANTDLNMGGDTNTRIGYNCNGDSGYTNNTYISASSSAITYAPNITISGNTTEITGTSDVKIYGDDICITGNTDASLGAKTVKIGTDCGNNTIASGITINATTSVTVNAPTTIVTGDTYISGDTIIGGDTFISGDTTVDGDLIINIPCDSITSTTVNDALCEIMGRGVITMTRDSDPEDIRLAAVYKLFQNDEQIGYDINVPKDGFLKSVELVPVENVFYLRFTWYVYDADTKTYTTASTDVNVEDLVKDIEANNTKTTNRGATVDVWYNATTKKMNVSADTVINLVAAANAGSERKNGQHYLSASTLTFSGGTFSPGTHNAFGNGKTINIPTSTDDITNNLSYLKWSLGTPSADATGYNGSSAKTITIPSTPADIGMQDLKFTTGATNVSQSPYNGSAEKTITIPSKISNLTNDLSYLKWSLGTPSADATGYNGSSGKTITIPSKVSNLTNDLSYLKWSLGTPSADATGYNGSSGKTITIPSKISNLTNDLSGLTIESGNTYVSGSPYNGSSTAKIVVPASVDNLTNYTSYSDGAIHLPHNVVVTGSVSASLGFFQTSDERMKKFISPIDNDDFNKSANVFLRSFSMNDDETNRKMYGVIAQEVESAGLEEIVHTDENGYKTVDYTSLLILKLGYLDRMCSYLNRRIVELEEKLNNKE